MSEVSRWIIGIALGLIVALGAALFIRMEGEINRLRVYLHDLRDNLPKIILSWVDYALKRGPPPNGNDKK